MGALWGRHLEQSGQGQAGAPRGAQDVGVGPWAVWSVEVGLQGHKAGGRRGLPVIHRVTSHPGCLGLRGFPGRGAFSAKAGKALGNQYGSVTLPVTGDGS